MRPGFKLTAALALAGAYAAYARTFVRRFEYLDPLDAEAPGSFLDIDGDLVHYVEAGSGPPAVLIHGWNGSTFSYRHTIPELAQRCRVVAVDLLGYGHSARSTTADLSLTGQARLVLRVMDRLGIERAHVIGHSMGGGVAQRLADLAPERVERLVLVDSVTVRQVRRNIRFGWLVAPLLWLAAPLVYRPTVWRRLMRSAFHDPAHVTPEVEEGYLKPLRMRGHLRAIAKQLLDRRTDEVFDPSRIRHETLVLWGEHDAWLSPAGGLDLVRRLPNARLEHVWGAAHAPLEEQPVLSNKLLLAFLSPEDQAEAAADETAAPTTAG